MHGKNSSKVKKKEKRQSTCSIYYYFRVKFKKNCKK